MNTRERLLKITDGKEILSVEQFAEFLSMDPKTIRKNIIMKCLPGSVVKRPGKLLYVIPVDSVVAWIEKSGQVGA